MGEEFETFGEGTGGSSMNVLMISNDSSLAMDKEKVIGDSQDRHILYGKYLSKLFIVVRSGKDQNLKARKLSDNVIVYPTSSRKFFSVWDAYELSKTICRENKIDVITTQEPHSAGIAGYMLKRKFNIPLNVQIHYIINDKLYLKESKLNYIRNKVSQFILKRADSIRVVNNQIEDSLLKVGISPEKIFSFHIFTDISKFTSSGSKLSVRERYPQFKYIVLFVGVLRKVKNVDTLLIAADKVTRKHPEALFLIIGDGPEKEKLIGLVRKLGITQNVRFEDKVPFINIPSYYRACDLLALPSWRESWGRVVVEALTNKKPVVISDTCGCANVMANGEHGLLFPPSRPDILARKILYLIENPELGKKMGEAGREYVLATEGIERNAYKHKELYERTIEIAKRKKI